MNKIILLSILSLLPIHVFANNAYVTEIVKKSTHMQQGYNRSRKATTECNYRSYRFATNDDSYATYGIEISSDSNTFIYGSIQFEQKDLPLQDGVIFTRDQEVANYKNGILIYEARQGNGPFSSLLTEIELKVSRDLNEISSINLKKSVIPVIGFNTVDTELNCQFPMDH